MAERNKGVATTQIKVNDYLDLELLKQNIISRKKHQAVIGFNHFYTRQIYSTLTLSYSIMI